MTQNNVTIPHVDKGTLAMFMLVGGGIALVLISLMVLPVEGKPEWGHYWKIRPMIVPPVAGAIGGACFYIIWRAAYKGGWRKVLAGIAGTIIYILGIWMGTVLGCAGTLWN